MSPGQLGSSPGCAKEASGILDYRKKIERQCSSLLPAVGQVWGTGWGRAAERVLTGHRLVFFPGTPSPLHLECAAMWGEHGPPSHTHTHTHRVCAFYPGSDHLLPCSRTSVSVGVRGESRLQT